MTSATPQAFPSVDYAKLRQAVRWAKTPIWIWVAAVSQIYLALDSACPTTGCSSSDDLLSRLIPLNTVMVLASTGTLFVAIWFMPWGRIWLSPVPPLLRRLRGFGRPLHLAGKLWQYFGALGALGALLAMTSRAKHGDITGTMSGFFVGLVVLGLTSVPFHLRQPLPSEPVPALAVTLRTEAVVPTRHVSVRRRIAARTLRPTSRQIGPVTDHA
jgi:hypothetical protein